MIDKNLCLKLRAIAAEEMKRRRAKHACYGLSYDDVEELADFPEEIKYFNTTEEFYAWINQRREHYASFGITDVAFYAVHART